VSEIISLFGVPYLIVGILFFNFDQYAFRLRRNIHVDEKVTGLNVQQELSVLPAILFVDVEVMRPP